MSDSSPPQHLQQRKGKRGQRKAQQNDLSGANESDLHLEWADRLANSVGLDPGWKRSLESMSKSIVETTRPLIQKATPYIHSATDKLAPLANKATKAASPLLEKARSLKDELSSKAGNLANDISTKMNLNERINKAHEHLPQRLQPLAEKAVKSSVHGLRLSHVWITSQVNSSRQMMIDLSQTRSLLLQSCVGVCVLTMCFVPILFLNTPEARMILLAFSTSVALATAAYKYRGKVTPLMSVACVSWIPLLFYLWTLGGIGDKYAVEMALALEKGEGVTPQSLRVGTRWYVFVLWVRFVMMSISAALPTLGSIAWRELSQLKDEEVFGTDIKNLNTGNIKQVANEKFGQAKRSVRNAMNQASASTHGATEKLTEKTKSFASGAQEKVSKASDQINESAHQAVNQGVSRAQQLKQSMRQNSGLMDQSRGKYQQYSPRQQTDATWKAKDEGVSKASNLKDQASEVAGQAMNKVSQAKDRAIDKAADLKEKSGNKASQIKDQLTDLTNQAANKASQLKDETAAKASQIKAQASQLGEQATEKVSQLKDQAINKASELSSSSSSSASSSSGGSNSLKDKAAGAMHDVQDKAAELKSKAAAKMDEISNALGDKMEDSSRAAQEPSPIAKQPLNESGISSLSGSEHNEPHELSQGKLNRMENLLGANPGVGGTGLGPASGLNLDKSLNIAPATNVQDTSSKGSCVIPNCTDSRVTHGYCIKHASEATQIAHPGVQQDSIQTA